jgi:DNA-binding XRE family transcriptional regulator
MITFNNDPPQPSLPFLPEAPVQPLPLPGTPAHQRLLRERAAAGQPLHQPGDVLHDPEQLVHRRRLRNGHDGLVKERPVVKKRAEVDEKPSLVRDRNRGRRTPMAHLARPQLASLGQRLRDLRQGRGWSLGQLALSTGVSRQALHHLETGRSGQPTLAVLWSLADAYRLSLDELVGRR